MRLSERQVRAIEWLAAFLAFLIIPALILEDRATDPTVREAAHIVNWVVWIAFCGEFLARWAASGKRQFVREAWFDLLLILVSPPFLVPDYLQGARSLRAIRAI